MDLKIWESAYERGSMIIMVMCYPYHIVRLANNTDEWGNNERVMMGSNGRYCLLTKWIMTLPVQKINSDQQVKKENNHWLSTLIENDQNNDCYCFSYCFQGFNQLIWEIWTKTKIINIVEPQINGKQWGTLIMVRFWQSKSLDPCFLVRKIDLATQKDNLTKTRPVIYRILV